MTQHAHTAAIPPQQRAEKRFEVRSITGARYTLVEEAERDGDREPLHRRYRTAYAGLPVTANDDGSFTLVETQTRLLPVNAR